MGSLMSAFAGTVGIFGSVKTWLLSSAPVIGLPWGVVILALADWALGRFAAVRPNSALGALAHGLNQLLGKVPGVGQALAWVAQPSGAAPSSALAKSAAAKADSSSGFVALPFLAFVAILAGGALFFALTLSGCYCWTHGSDPKCAGTQEVKGVVTNCAEPAVEKAVAQILPQVVAALVAENWSQLVDGLIQTLKQQGVQDALGLVTCAVESVDGNLVAPRVGAAEVPRYALPVKAHAGAWLEEHARVPDGTDQTQH